MASSLPSRPAAGPALALSSGSSADAHVYEEEHVHHVYEAIAPHFSATRHKPWPFVSSFLASQPPGSVGLDVGCGNGKNMGVNHNVVMLGCDRSAALVALARHSWCTPTTTTTTNQPHAQQAHQQQASSQDQTEVKHRTAAGHGPVIAGADVAVADGLVLPFREGSADFVICIAVIHHLSTRERRVDAIRHLLRCIRRRTDPVEKQQQGQVLVYVWALEQSSSRRGWDEGGEQDLLVPWVMKAPQQPKKKQQPQGQGNKAKHPNKKSGAAKDPPDGGAPAKQHGDKLMVSWSSGGEGGEGGRGAVVMQGHRQESHNNHLVDRSRDVSRETATTTGAAEDKGAQEGGVAAAEAEENAFAAAADNAKRADDGQQQQGPGQGSRWEKQAAPAPAAGPEEGLVKQGHADQTFHRFYHLYKKGELEQDVAAAGGQVVSSGYERDNWWVIAG